MTLPLAGMNVALAEGRQLEELATLLEKEGATPVRCPLLTILDAADSEPILAWLRRLIAGEFGLLILLTGEGVRRLTALAERHALRRAFVEALARTPTLTRGPKPGQALKELGLRPTYVATAPTTAGVIATLQGHSVAGKTVGVQLYSENNPPLTTYLEGAGAKAVCVQPYYYAPASDADRVAQLVEQMAQGGIAVLVFTSSPQIERVCEVVAERHLEEPWLRGLARTKLASVGPIVTETLNAKGLRADIQPEQGFQMKNLVVHIRRALTGL